MNAQPTATPAPSQAQAPAAPVEAANRAPVADTPSPAIDPALQSRLATLAKKEALLVKQASEARAERAAAEKLRAEAKAIEDRWNGYKGRPEKAKEALKELGYDYNMLTQIELNGGELTPEMQIAQLRETIEADKAERQRQTQEASQRQLDAAKAQQEKEVANFKATLRSEAEDRAKYPLLNHYGVYDEVWSLVEGHFNATTERDESGNVIKAGQVLEPAEASVQIETHLRKLATEAQALLNPQPAQATPSPSLPQKQPPKQSGQFKPVPTASKPTTLANVPSPTTTPTSPRKFNSEADRMADLLARHRASKGK